MSNSCAIQNALRRHLGSSCSNMTLLVREKGGISVKLVVAGNDWGKAWLCVDAVKADVFRSRYRKNAANLKHHPTWVIVMILTKVVRHQVWEAVEMWMPRDPVVSFRGEGYTLGDPSEIHPDETRVTANS